jgi:hypothetical protein
MHITLFGLRPNKSETKRQKNYHVGLLIILLYSHKAVPLKNVPTCHQTRFCDALARFSCPTYNLRTTESQGLKNRGQQKWDVWGGGATDQLSKQGIPSFGQKLSGHEFQVYWVDRWMANFQNYSTPTEYAVKIFWIFHRKWWKFRRAQKFWQSAEILEMWCWYKSRYSTGETLPIKAERPEPSDHLRSTCTRGDITWTRALQPDLEEVSSWRFCRAQIVSRRTTWAPNFLVSAEIFIRRGDFNVRLSSSVYYVVHEFYKSA